jgi:dephospho-CoA kinase
MTKIKQPIVALSGLAQTGKDTAAILLKDILHGQCFNFALPVTDACARDLQMTHTYFLRLPKNKVVSNGLTKRQFMQQKGKELRNADPFYMVNQMHRRLLTSSSIIIITDVRMPQEAAYIRQQGGIIIHIRRPISAQAPSDETEQHLDINDGDYIINNNGTKSNYEQKIRALATCLGDKISLPKAA